MRDDCEQMTGRCMCRPDAVGLKCERCKDGQLIDSVADGCRNTNAVDVAVKSETASTAENEWHHCSQLSCRFGAICQYQQGQAVCVCPMSCPSSSSAYQTVCGSDGVSYGSECDLRLAACRRQLPVTGAYEGPCSDEMTTKTTRQYLHFFLFHSFFFVFFCAVIISFIIYFFDNYYYF